MLNDVRDQTEGVRYLRKIVDGTLTSALLLVGDDGVGKKFSVISAAKEIFSRDNPNAIFQIDQGLHPDFKVVSPEDGKDIGVQVIRDIVEASYSHPSTAPKKFVVIDGAHKLTDAAANAFLKTLEEAPDHTLFFLLTNSAESVIPTIRSRCGKVRYKRLSEEFVVDRISKFESDPTKALVYARLADGSLGRALQFFGSSRLTLRDRTLGLLRIAQGRDVSAIFLAIDDIGEDLPLAIHFLDHLLCDLAMFSYLPDRISNLDLIADLSTMAKQLGSAKVRQLSQGLRALRSHKAKIKTSAHLKALLASTFVS